MKRAALTIASRIRGGCLLVASFALSACAAGALSRGPSPQALQRVTFVAQTRRPPAVCPCLYVTNYGSDSVTVYPAGATGNQAPIQNITGSNTGLIEPIGVAVDESGNQLAVFGRRGARPFNRAEASRLYLHDGKPYTVPADPPNLQAPR